MASSYHQYLNCSKSQMCLFKILRIISSIPAPPSKEEAFPSNNKGVGIDLNLRFCSVAESGESESSVETAGNASAIEQGNNKNEGEGEEGPGEKSVDTTQVQSFGVDNNNGVDDVESESEDEGEGNGGGAETSSFRGRGREGGGDSNCLDLLIKAARVLSGKEESESESESESEEERGVGGELRTQGASHGRVKKRKERWMVVDLYGGVVEEERQPVVRSKRGRNQALPYRFRDSVVEPLKCLGRSHRQSSTANARKRLLR